MEQENSGSFLTGELLGAVAQGALTGGLGTAAKVAVGTFVLSKCKRFASRGEQVFATGVGLSATPGLLTFEGSITAQNISDALRA